MTDVFVGIPGGEYRLGSDRHYPEERPARMITLAAFEIAATPVTNSDFARFVAATDYVTVAERSGVSAVFIATAGPVDLNTPSRWWHAIAGAFWHCPEGPGSTIASRPDHPVVHLALTDALAYAEWANARLPSEAEWEAAARGGLQDSDYAWGDEMLPGGIQPANFWTGNFPWYHTRMARPGTMPVGHYPTNGYGLADMIGNVWEWTTTAASSDAGAPEHRCCAPEETANDLIILKGGSFLCAAEYCQRYRPAARIAVGSAMTSAHIGFRIARDA